LAFGFVSLNATSASNDSAPTSPTPYVLVDASKVNRAAIVYSTADVVLGKASALHFFRLSPPLSSAFECCAYVTRAQAPSRDLASYALNADTPSRYTTAKLRERSEVPFFALGLVGVADVAPRILREDEHTFLILNKGGKPEHRVQHCVSTETFHVRITEAASARELLRYSLPLGMDVEADCTDVLMPPSGRTR
jgi:hypothetical protein